MIVHFTELFTVHNGIITPKVTVQINGITLSPGVSFGRGITFGGTDLSLLTNDYLEVEKDLSGVIIIKGQFQF